MFLHPLTLQDLSVLGDPTERVPLGERVPYEEGLALIEQGYFQGFDIGKTTGPLRLQLRWRDNTHNGEVSVGVIEGKIKGALNFSCSACTQAGRQAVSCEHQWASYVLIWHSLASPSADLKHPDLAALAKILKGPAYLGAILDEDGPATEWDLVRLDSISLFFDEPALLRGDEIGSLLTLDLSAYRKHDVRGEEERHSPRLWNLPDIFRRKLTAYSGHHLNEVNAQNRMTDVIRYNFSNGMQISAKEVLRHPLHRRVPGEFLPQARGASPAPPLSRWPLIQYSDKTFVSQAVQEPEEIMQALLYNLAEAHRKKRVELYLQTPIRPGRALKLVSIEFDPTQELDWRVEFREKKELETEFKLVNFRKNELAFYESFAVDPIEGVIIVHPWLRELSQLQEVLSGISDDLRLSERKMPGVEVIGELDSKIILKYLRTRKIPVKISGESRVLGAHQSQTEVHLDESGSFYIQHEARVFGQVNLVRRGFSTQTVLYVQSLSQGLPFLLRAEAREVAGRTYSKREWDMKILKHVGILQYLFMETLSVHFTGALTDGTVVLPEQIFTSLHAKIQILLIAGSGGTLVRDLTLSELCSKAVLACFDDFVRLTLTSMTGREAFYSEHGEVILEGVVEREFRLLFELLKKSALATGGETFRRSRTPLLAKITAGEFAKDPSLNSLLFHFQRLSPGGDGKNGTALNGALESLQTLIPYGFRIFYKDQPLQELKEDEFHVDFLLQSDSDQRFFNWFELNPKFFLRGEEVDPDQFLSLGGGGVIEYSGKLFLVPQKQMPSLRRLENFWRKLQNGKVETGRKKNGEKIYQLPRSQTLELLALRSSGVGLRGDAEWNKLCEFYDNLGVKTRELKLPASVTGELKPYQVLGVQWLQDLYNLRLGALLADDMGLGKTLQTLAFLEDLRSKDDLGQVLIVVPSSLIFNWQQEAEKFTPKLPITVFANRGQDHLSKRLVNKEQFVVLTTYGLLMEHGAYLSQYKWKVLVFDEAQNLKNISTKRTSAARSLTAQFKICLTGTPMENHYGEFYSLVDLLVPGSLGKIEDFRRQFVNTELVTREEMQDLKLKIKPLLLRRTKREILDQLPEKQETKISIAFEDQQKQIYRDIALAYNQRVQETMASQGEASVQLQMLTALLRLRQACSDPAALPNVHYSKVPPKLETLLDSLAEIVESGESALVFTQFLQTLEHTVKILREAKIPVFVLHGGIPTKQRQKVLAEFTETVGGAVLVMTLKTGGVGLNLTKASYVFHLEPWWNPSVENQATDRAHRLGQNRAVQVFRYIMHESLEEKIELLKDRKDRKFQSLFATTEKDVEISAGSALSKSDFDMLLGLD